MSYSPPDSPEQPRDESYGKVAMFLPFDQAYYHSGKVPCQLLAATFYLSKLSYCFDLGDGLMLKLDKAQIKSLMASGWYVFCPRKTIVFAAGELLPSLELKFSRQLLTHHPAMDRVPSSKDQFGFLGVFAKHFNLSGRCRLYRSDGSTGVAMNLQSYIRKVNGPEENQEIR